MQRAKACGIDAFALNIGTNSFTDTQLGYAYTSAQNNGMKVFLSFDFAWWSTSDSNAIGTMIAQYADKPAQLVVDNKVFVSSFVGDGLNVAAVRSASGRSLYFVPNFSPYVSSDFSAVDGAFNWMGWPNNGRNRAPAAGQTGTVEAGDQKYISALNGKDYLAPVSPWFFTHYGTEVSYSKNWLFPGDRLWFDRWTQLLTMGPRFIEIISWNDYGESHYVGPLSSPHYDDGASKWVNDMPHDGWLEMAKPFIAAFKAGATKPDNFIASDQLIYWYRPQLKTSNCDSTDTCADGRPDGWQTVSDSLFVVALLKSAGTVRITSGSSTQEFQAAAGASMFTMPVSTGQQKFALIRNSQSVLEGTSLKDIIDGCQCGLYNFNAYVGMLPSSGEPPGLSADSLSMFSKGLKVSVAASPSLSASKTSSTTVTSSTATTSTLSKSATISSTSSTNAKTSTSNSSPKTTTTSSLTASATKTTADLFSASPVCVSGSGFNNYAGLCSFGCYFGYCPSGPCTCSRFGAQNPLPPVIGVNGVPADGLDQSYAGLCSFACNRGYCPSGACKAV